MSPVQYGVRHVNVIENRYAVHSRSVEKGTEKDVAPPIDDWMESAVEKLGYDFRKPEAMVSPWAGADAFWGGILAQLIGGVEVPADVFAEWADVAAEEEAAFGPLANESWPPE